MEWGWGYWWDWGKVLDADHEALALAPERAGSRGLAPRDSYLAAGTGGLAPAVPAAAPGPAHGTAARRGEWNHPTTTTPHPL